MLEAEPALAEVPLQQEPFQTYVCFLFYVLNQKCLAQQPAPVTQPSPPPSSSSPPPPTTTPAPPPTTTTTEAPPPPPTTTASPEEPVDSGSGFGNSGAGFGTGPSELPPEFANVGFGIGGSDGNGISFGAEESSRPKQRYTY